MNYTPKVRPKTFGVFFMKYSHKQRLIIVNRVKQGEAIVHLSKEYHIKETQILAWVRMWNKYGRSALEQQAHCRPTVKLKKEVVRLTLEKGVPLSNVRIEYRISKTALQHWDSTMVIRLLSRPNAEGNHQKNLWDVQRRKKHKCGT